jgi:lysophospholipase L1-like esterase
MIWNEILCLGDSITFGARDRFGRSYPAELGKILFEETGEFYYCHNYSQCGDTSSDLLRKTWNASKGCKDAKLALIMIGTNDTQIPIPENIYRDNLRQILSIVKIHGKFPIVATLPKLGFTPLYLKNCNYIDKYNQVIEELSSTMDFEICNMENTEKYYIDNVHYTHEGYNVLAKRFADKILNLQKGVRYE